MKKFITKYALTSGILEQECKETTFPELVEYEAGGYTVYVAKGNHFSTKEAAVAKAEKMRKKKIESLYKQIYKLESLTF